MGFTLAAGINDATTFPDYHVFASNQTGNTALLAVCSPGIRDGIVDLRDVGFSLGKFKLGGYDLGQLGDYFGRKRRGWLLSTNVLQTVLVYVVAALRKWVARSGGPSAWSVIYCCSRLSLAAVRNSSEPSFPSADSRKTSADEVATGC